MSKSLSMADTCLALGDWVRAAGGIGMNNTQGFFCRATRRAEMMPTCPAAQMKSGNTRTGATCLRLIWNLRSCPEATMETLLSCSARPQPLNIGRSACEAGRRADAVVVLFREKENTRLMNISLVFSFSL
jgi:hypothetical protein